LENGSVKEIFFDQFCL